VGRALVTGATGLVGSYIVDRLRKDNWDVRALVRSPATWLESLGVECVTGDVLDAERFSGAACDCDIIFHTAAAVTTGGGWEAFRRLNIDGTANAIAAAEQTRARLLHLSSVAVYGPEARYQKSVKTDEDMPLGPLPEQMFYARSKRESESLVMEAHRTGRVWATAVRPDVIYGRRDRQFVPRIARILTFGIAPSIDGGRATLAMVHAANVADGAVRAAMSDRAGGRAYNLANDFDVTARDFFLLAGNGLGKRVRLFEVSKSAAQRTIGGAIMALKTLSMGRMSVLSKDSLDFLMRDNPFTSERARRELGWAPTMRHEEGIPDAFRWWRENH
jgi:nucleoside-diphosphate-sugar epimerase